MFLGGWAPGEACERAAEDRRLWLRLWRPFEEWPGLHELTKNQGACHERVFPACCSVLEGLANMAPFVASARMMSLGVQLCKLCGLTTVLVEERWRAVEGSGGQYCTCLLVLGGRQLGLRCLSSRSSLVAPLGRWPSALSSAAYHANRARAVYEEHEQRAGRIAALQRRTGARARDAPTARCWRSLEQPARPADACKARHCARHEPAVGPVSACIRKRSSREDHRREGDSCWPSAAKRNLGPPQTSHRGCQRARRGPERARRGGQRWAARVAAASDWQRDSRDGQREQAATRASPAVAGVCSSLTTHGQHRGRVQEAGDVAAALVTGWRRASAPAGSLSLGMVCLASTA